jgi:hypothetical protein
MIVDNDFSLAAYPTIQMDWSVDARIRWEALALVSVYDDCSRETFSAATRSTPFHLGRHDEGIYLDYVLAFLPPSLPSQ